MGKECSPRVPLGERWRAVFWWPGSHASLRHSVNKLNLKRNSLHWFFISYFTLVLPAGQVAGVLASSDVILFSGDLLCYAKHPEGAKSHSKESHHHSGQHSHGGVDGHQHPSSHPTPDPEIPYIHCNPLGLDFALANLLIPFVLAEMHWLPEGRRDSRPWVPQKLAIYFRNEPPPTPPPPRSPILVEGALPQNHCPTCWAP